MNTRLPLKIAVISGFILLIGAFVAFRTGVFEKQEQIPNTDTLITPSADTIVKADTTVPVKEMMPGSKIMVLPKIKDGSTSGSTDEPKKVKEKEKVMMHGSKSGKVIDPKSTNQEKNNNAEQTTTVIDLNESMMGSSKSGIIFKPAKDTSKKQDQK